MARNAQLGLACCTRERWMRLHELADDRDQLDDTFEDWQRGATAEIRELEAAGRQVRKVPVGIEALAA